MKAILQFSLPEEKAQFEAAIQAETWQVLLVAIIKELSDMCRAENGKEPNCAQLRELLNNLEMKMHYLEID